MSKSTLAFITLNLAFAAACGLAPTSPDPLPDAALTGAEQAQGTAAVSSVGSAAFVRHGSCGMRGELTLTVQELGKTYAIVSANVPAPPRCEALSWSVSPDGVKAEPLDGKLQGLIVYFDTNDQLKYEVTAVSVAKQTAQVMFIR